MSLLGVSPPATARSASARPVRLPESVSCEARQYQNHDGCNLLCSFHKEFAASNSNFNLAGVPSHLGDSLKKRKNFLNTGPSKIVAGRHERA